MLEVLREDYVRTARAKGLKERTVVYGHALKNALIPVLTIFGLQMGQLLAGAIIIENVFTLPGLGGWSSRPSASGTCPWCGKWCCSWPPPW
jgi:ABC-type dipeptide/oligopeptide/nickel transport system permease component